MKYQYWKCKICGEEFRTSTLGAKFDLEDHFKKHKKELAELENAEEQYNKQELRLRDKYKKQQLGYWIKNITPPVKKRLWKCPECEEKMTYHDKYWHLSNKH